ncbi:MAG: HAD-IB family hydrolase [Gammaproteobacteria bacterium]|nr:HAD-IB family hydrolase [Gammaproteobacteria bacterium]NCF60394.1 HAD-IB family hydrolase [Gammaproteobacteria bacterium]
MQPYEHFTREIAAGLRGKTTAAFFDFDGTIIATHSVRDMFLERLKNGEISSQELFDLGDMVTRYLLNVSGFGDALVSAVRNLKGMPERELIELGEKVTREHLAAEIFPEVRAMIAAHEQQGHTVVIVSSATRYQIEPVAKLLGVEHILCTELELEDGRFTGRLKGEACFAENKLQVAQDFAGKQRVKLGKSYFYTNGIEDLSLLEAVGHPVTINPDRKLADVVRENGWRAVHLESRGTFGVGDVVRSLLVYGTALPLLAAGLPIRALGASEREATNISLSAWTSVASAIARLKLLVDGEEHLWSHRPAVFIFNHQSAVDVLITARMLREDVIGVAKKEIKHQLPMGLAFTYTGTIFIDREHVGDPQLALKPAVDALRSGRSVVIAPEGTRSRDGTLGPFKLGAFHLARQVGVPIVPIVIHNAQDALPYKGVVVHPAEVKVTVLPPQPSDKWRLADVEAQARRIREMYLDALGQRRQAVSA